MNKYILKSIYDGINAYEYYIYAVNDVVLKEETKLYYVASTVDGRLFRCADKKNFYISSSALILEDKPTIISALDVAQARQVTMTVLSSRMLGV